MTDDTLTDKSPTARASSPVTDAAAKFSVFLQLEKAARDAQTREALAFSIVNDSKRLFGYRQSILTLLLPNERWQVEAISGVALLERDAPYLQWLNAVFRSLPASATLQGPLLLGAEQLPAGIRDAWTEWSAPHVLCVPLRTQECIGLWWLARDEPWREGEQLLASQLAHAYAHAWNALVGKPRRMGFTGRRAGLLLAVMIGLLAIPVPQSALAPAEITAADPWLVAAPIDGVIARFAVEPNQPVAPGQELFRFDDTNLKSERDVAQRTLEVAEAELKRASQGAFTDKESSAQIALLQARVALRKTELSYAQALFDRLIVRADRQGVAVFADPMLWIGRPVKTGERILQIADPAKTELRIHLPIGQAITLEKGAEVKVFLDNDPLNALSANLTQASYEAEPQPDGTLAYQLDAAFAPSQPLPRIGLRGTAKVYGEDAPLFYYLFRRPLSALRQTLGF